MKAAAFLFYITNHPRNLLDFLIPVIIITIKIGARLRIFMMIFVSQIKQISGIFGFKLSQHIRSNQRIRSDSRIRRVLVTFGTSIDEKLVAGKL